MASYVLATHDLREHHMMDSIDLDEIASATVISDGSPFKSIYIPKNELLTSEQRRIVIAKAEARDRERTFVEDLDQRLQDLTPPPEDEEEILEQARQLDHDARKELKALGCLPCYPPSVDLPITKDSLSELQFGAAKYFEQIAPEEGAILASQLRYWKGFLKYQEQIRRPDRKSDFQKSAARIRKRYRAQKLVRDFALRSDHTRQTKLENWTEYQDYQLGRLQELVTHKLRLEDKLSADLIAYPDHDVDNLRYPLKCVSRRTEAKSCLLEWIQWEWYHIAALDEGPSLNYDRPALEDAAAVACTHGRYNLRPRTNGRVAKSKPQSATGLHGVQNNNATENLVLTKTRSSGVSKAPIKRSRRRRKESAHT